MQSDDIAFFFPTTILQLFIESAVPEEILFNKLKESMVVTLKVTYKFDKNYITVEGKI